MKITPNKLIALEKTLTAACAAEQRMASLRLGVIEGAPSIDAEQAAVLAARSELIAALSNAGPSLQKKFGWSEWRHSFNADGSLRF